MKDWMYFFDAGGERYWMEDTWLGSILIPKLYAICPSSLLDLSPKIDVVGFNDIPYFLQEVKSLARWSKWST